MAVFTPLCSSSCREKRLNEQCDFECNSEQCLFDANECEPPKSERSSFYDSVDFTNALLNDKIGYSYRYWAEHIPLMINKRIIMDLQSTFSHYYEITSSHHTRQPNDVQYEFAYINWLLEAPNSRLRKKIYPHLYRSTIVGVNDFHYVPYGHGSIGENKELLRQTLAQRFRPGFYFFVFLEPFVLIEERKNNTWKSV